MVEGGLLDVDISLLLLIPSINVLWLVKCQILKGRKRLVHFDVQRSGMVQGLDLVEVVSSPGLSLVVSGRQFITSLFLDALRRQLFLRRFLSERVSGSASWGVLPDFLYSSFVLIVAPRLLLSIMSNIGRSA